MKIKLSEEKFDEGFKTIITSGSVVYTPEEHVYYVPPATVETLRALKIPFTRLDTEPPTTKERRNQD